MATNLMTPSETSCGPATAGGLERTRFYPRQLVGADDLTQDQRYVREKLRRHNRLLHGWGVVCGACVRANRQNPCEIIVDPGYVLGPHGDEIVIAEPVPFDVCKQGVVEQVGCCPESDDPWCAEPRGRCPEGRFFLAIRYAECPSRPVRAGACGCGCDGEACEYSRIRDSFALKILTELPQGYSTPMPQPSFMGLMTCSAGVARACPPCPDHPWVILADVTIGRDCRVVGVDCFTHRRNVMSLASFFFICAGRVFPAAGIGVFDSAMERIRMLSSLTGGTDIVDLAMGASASAPRAMVTMLRPSGESVVVPAFFPVERGMTVADLLEREGDREFFDPTTNRRLTLRDLYAHAEADPDSVLDSAAAALAPLEGRTLDVVALGANRTVLEETLGAKGLDRLDRRFLGSPARARALPATEIGGVEPRSPLAGKLKNLTIAKVADQPKEEFVAAITRGAAAKSRGELEAQAAKAWEAATRIAALGSTGDN